MLYVETDPSTSRRIRATLHRLGFPSAEQERNRQAAFRAEQLEAARWVVVAAIRAEAEGDYRENVAPYQHTPAADGLAWRNHELFELAVKLEAFTFEERTS